MPTIRELGLLANAVYDDSPSVSGWTCPAHHRAGGILDGFQAATFTRNGATVIAFRGTAQAVDAAVDLRLGCGMNTAYFSAAEDYAVAYPATGDVFVCGHSLGGAIAQVVANRGGYRFVSFNAPGVAVFASRNIGEATVGMTLVRTVGMVNGVVFNPVQAYRDVRSAFRTVQGLNVCLEHDLVSKIGVHYGRVTRVPGTSNDPLTEHRMTTVNTVLATNPVGQLDVATL